MTSIFVAKLDFNATEEQLKTAFEAYGRVNRITIAKDRETGKPRGFAFVEMNNEAEADEAIKNLDNFVINGRPITVKKADDRGNSKPQGDRPQRHQGDRPPRQNFTPRDNNDRGGSSDYKSDYKKNDDRPVSRGPVISPDDIQPAKVERKKEVKSTPKASDAPKKNKMEAYRKSGKDNQYLDDEDYDEELDLFGRNGDEDEDDEDYRKYLVNSDDDSDEDYDDEDYDDEDYDDED